MFATPASRLPASVVTRLVPIAVGTEWTPDPAQTELAWEQPLGHPATGDGVVVHEDDSGDAEARVETGVESGVKAAAHDEPSLEEGLATWATRFAQALVEVVSGHRPPAQLVQWTSRTVYRDLERRTRLTQRAATTEGGTPVLRSRLRPQVRSVRVCPVGVGVAEVSVHVRHGRRSRALALRLELVRARWTCTAVEFA